MSAGRRIATAVVVLLVIALVLLVLQMSRSATTPEIATNGSRAPTAAGSRAAAPRLSSARPTAPVPTATTSEDVVSAQEDDQVPASLRTQFNAFLGGDLQDACGLDTQLFPPEVDAPFFGPASQYYDDQRQYSVGDPILWCIYGFFVDAPIAVTVSGPHGTVERFVVVLTTDGGAACWFGRCRRDEYLHLIDVERQTSTYRLRSERVFGPPAGAVSGWILPSSRAGRYVVAAAQGHLRTSVDVVVENAPSPRLSVVSWMDGAGSDGYSALLTGYQPGTDVGLHLYALRYVNGGYDSIWSYDRELAAVSTDGRGSAVYDFRAPADLRPGQYCVVTAATTPVGDPTQIDERGEITDPC